ncbi:uncharacterized protein LOC112687842 [Sipha flava]|uniref:Uncharacterized protein LOC112687842 n=2 Tax=Sipha flava TaxID=143950 RepID=A0A8B8G1P6_9HEMI|nr:uncharacterized protein LOC112687842 [Sipha flava]
MNIQIRPFFYLFLTIFHLFKICIVAAITPDDLKCMCGLVNGANIVKQLPPGCKTAVVTIADTDSLRENIGGIRAANGNIPIMLVYDYYSLDFWKNNLTTNLKSIISQIQSLHVDAIVLENTYNVSVKVPDVSFTNLLVKSLQEFKCMLPTMMFGIAMPAKANIIINSYNLTYLNNYVDFYLLKATDPTGCMYKKHQDEMDIMMLPNAIVGKYTIK